MTAATPNTIEIKIKGTVDPSLAASAAIAKQQFNSLKAETDALAAKMVETGATGDAALVATLGRVAGEAEVAGQKYKTIMKDMSQATHGLSTSRATYEFTALFDELSSGRARRAPATLALIGQRVLGLNGATLLAVGGVVAIGAAIGALAYDAIKADYEMGRLGLTAKALGDQETTSQLTTLRNVLAELPGVSRASASAIESAVENMGVTARPAIEGLALAANQYALAYGVKAVDAAKAFQKVLTGQHVTTASVLQDIHGLTAAQAEQIATVARGNNINATAAEIMRVIAQNTGRLGHAFDKSTSGIERSWSNLQLWLGVLEQSRSVEQTFDIVHTKTTKLWDAQTEAILNNAAALQTRTNIGEAALDAAIRLSANSTHAQITQLNAQIAELKAELSDPKATEDEKANFRSMISDNERQLQALKDRSFKDTGFSNAGAEAIAQARETVSEINSNQRLGDAERLAEVEKTYNALLASGKLNAAQRLSVQTELNKAITSEEKRAVHEQEQINADHERTQVQLARIAFEEKKATLDAEVSAGRLTRQQELSDLISNLNRIEALQLQAVDDATKGYAKDSVEYAKAQDQKLLIAARTAQQIKQLQAQMAADATKEYGNMLNTVLGSEQQMVRGLISGTQTFGAMFEQIALNVAEKWVDSELKMLTQHIFTEEAKTASTASGTAQREAIEASENSSILGRLFSTLAQWLGIETTKTEATVTGAAIRKAAESSSLTGNKSLLSSIASSSIMKDAGRAAAATYATVSEIPVVGPFLAPEAAAAAFAAVAAFDTVASAAGGQWQVPYDGQPTILHKDEMVLPAWVANPVRTSLTNLASQGPTQSGGGTYHQHVYNINAVDAASFMQLVQRNPEVIASVVSRQWNTNMSLRPSY